MDPILVKGIFLLALVLPWSIAATYVVAVGLGVLWAGARLFRRPVPPLQTRPILFPFLIFFGCTILSALFGIDVKRSLISLREEWLVLMVFLPASLLTHPHGVEKATRIFIWSTVGTVFFALIQYAIGINRMDQEGGLQIFQNIPAVITAWPRWILNKLTLHGHRVAATRSHPLTFAGCLTMGWAVVLGLFIYQPERRKAWGFALAAGAAALILSLSRGPWLAAAVILAIGLGFAWRSVPRGFWIGLALMVLAGILFPTTRARFETIWGVRREISNFDRMLMWTSGMRIIRKHPLFGLGLSNVKKMPEEFQPKFPTGRGAVGHLHSNYVNLAAERGLVGFSGFLFFLWCIGKMLWKGSRSPSPSPVHPLRGLPMSKEGCSWAGPLPPQGGEERGEGGFSKGLLLGAFLAYLAFLVMGVTETVYNDEEPLMTFYFIVGLALALTCIQRNAT